MTKSEHGQFPEGTPACGCECGDNQTRDLCGEMSATSAGKKVLLAELLVIDLETCSRCIPTGYNLKAAVQLLEPVAEAMGIDLRHRETVVQTEEEAKVKAVLSSPTIRLNGRDIAQDIRESECTSCGELTDNGTVVECREWHYRGQVYPSAPLSMLVEAITQAMLDIDKMPPVPPVGLEELPENLRVFFRNKKRAQSGTPCCC